MSSQVEKRTPPEWEIETGIKIVDPDGWDRRNLAEEWKRPLTLEEFRDRAAISTIMDNGKGNINLFPRGEDKR